jgi:putative restriction endonuclease
MAPDADLGARLAAFGWLTDLRERVGESLTRAELREGYEYGGRRIPLIGPQAGIWKPASFVLPLSILTSTTGPYSDAWDLGRNRLRYDYRGTDPNTWDNVGLRRAMMDRVPLVYFHGLQPGVYAAAYPTFIVGDDPDNLHFWAQLDDIGHVQREDQTGAAENSELRRGYLTVSARRRLHQAAFRERVIHAYRERCALCRLGHRELIDAAHITPDADPMGEPHVSNGLALCKLHHAAFDSFFLGVDPDFVVRVSPRILGESDGPMLVVGLQRLDGQRISLPARRANWPNRDRLAQRMDRFKRAS